jgi:hypothetical protein
MTAIKLLAAIAGVLAAAWLIELAWERRFRVPIWAGPLLALAWAVAVIVLAKAFAPAG